MPNLQRSAVGAMFAALRTVAGETITVRRPGKDAITIAAVLGSTPIETIGDDGNNVTTQAADWIASAAAYAFEGSPTLPKRGDEIDWIDQLGAKRTFHVLPRGEDRCYRYTDQTRIQLRIHVIEKPANAESL